MGTSLNPEDRLPVYRRRLADLLEIPEPSDPIERGFRRGSINHCTDMIRHLNATIQRKKPIPRGNTELD